MPGLLDVVNQIGRGFSNIYEEQMPSTQQVLGLLGVAPAQASTATPATLIQRFENAQNKGFKDGRWYPHENIKEEKGPKTIAWGHKLTPIEAKTGKIKIGDSFVYYNSGLTPNQANELYEQDVAPHMATARKSLMRAVASGAINEIQPNQLEALTSLIYNVGPTSWNKSTAKQKLESGDIAGFLKQAFDPKIGFVRTGGKVIKGLQNRRSEERNLFMGGGN